jgi:hypothetical protein
MIAYTKKKEKKGSPADSKEEAEQVRFIAIVA